MIPWCPNARGSVLLAQAIALWLLVGVPSGVAADVSLSPYVIRTWQTDDGLPQNAITSVVQSKDGYLWVGTYGGLARFDGVRFQVFNSANTPALRSGRVTSLFEDLAGTLWIGSEIGELTACDPGPHFRAIDIASNWGRRKIIDMGRDEAGDLWLADAEGNLMRLKDGLRLEPKPGAATNLVSVTSDARGKFWVVRNGMASALEQGRLISQFGGDPSTGYVQGLCLSHQGGIWVASEGKLRRQNSNQTAEDYGAAPWDMAPLTALLETSAGMLAAGTQDHGLFVVRPGGAMFRLCRTNGLPSDWISSLCEDREGNLWAGTGGNGLIMVRRQRDGAGRARSVAGAPCLKFDIRTARSALGGHGGRRSVPLARRSLVALWFGSRPGQFVRLVHVRGCRGAALGWNMGWQPPHPSRRTL